DAAQVHPDEQAETADAGGGAPEGRALRDLRDPGAGSESDAGVGAEAGEARGVLSSCTARRTREGLGRLSFGARGGGRARGRRQRAPDAPVEAPPRPARRMKRPSPPANASRTQRTLLSLSRW